MLIFDRDLTFFATSLVDQRTPRLWFRYAPAIYKNKDKRYMTTASSCLDNFILSWQKIASKLYPMGDQWMKIMEESVLYIFFDIVENIRELTEIYNEISNILQELLGACHFHSVDSILKVTSTKKYNCEIDRYDYCQKLIKPCKEMSNINKKFEKNLKTFVT